MCTCEQRNHFTKSYNFVYLLSCWYTHVPVTRCVPCHVTETLANLQSSKNEDPVTVIPSLSTLHFFLFFRLLC